MAFIRHTPSYQMKNIFATHFIYLFYFVVISRIISWYNGGMSIHEGLTKWGYCLCGTKWIARSVGIGNPQITTNARWKRSKSCVTKGVLCVGTPTTTTLSGSNMDRMGNSPMIRIPLFRHGLFSLYGGRQILHRNTNKGSTRDCVKLRHHPVADKLWHGGSQSHMCVCVVQRERTEASQGFTIAFKFYSRKIYVCIDTGKISPHMGETSPHIDYSASDEKYAVSTETFTQLSYETISVYILRSFFVNSNLHWTQYLWPYGSVSWSPVTYIS